MTWKRPRHRGNRAATPRGGLNQGTVLGFTWLGPVVGPLSTAELVATMVIFMLLERRDRGICSG